MTTNRLTAWLGSISLALMLPALAASEGLQLEYHGAGWLQSGRVENSYSLPGNGNDYEKNWLGNVGGLLSAKAKIDENWEATFGMGSIMVHLARGAKGTAKKWFPFSVPFVDEAKFTRTGNLFTGEDQLRLNFGTFHYSYSSDTKNLGQYLLHGYVYPGTLQMAYTGPLGVPLNLSGVQASYSAGFFSNDIMAIMETDEKPLYDISVADVMTLRFHRAFELGLGINFYRLVPMDAKLTSPDKTCDENFLGPYAKQGQVNACYIVNVDSLGNPVDTVLGSLAGTKAMGRFRVDPVAFFSEEPGVLGKDAFVLYGEVGVLGLKNYKGMYDDILRRMPVMVGINLPGFNFLNASVEVEYYASKLSGNNLGAKNGSWVSAVDDPRINTKRDDWKWSVNVSKLLFGHMVLLGQVANDHLRLGGNHDEDTGVEAMRIPDDWYWTTKLAYFF